MNGIALSQQMLDSNRDVWDAMQSHRFVQDIAADELPSEVFARYLLFEYGFVETAICIFGHAMLKAPGFAQRRWLIGVMWALAEEQVGSFEAAFAALGITRSEHDAPVPEAVRAFQGGMLTVAATGSYQDILSIMLAAEWMYAAWCSQVDATRISSPELKRWVAMHAAHEFAAQVDRLRSELDAIGEITDAAERNRLIGLFRHALLLEIDFHEAVYDASWPVRRAREIMP